MLHVQSEEEMAEGQMHTGGFRLEQMEIYNWGTFNQRIWTMSPLGGTSLLTGANGSGKSTLVDALLTLLVPFRKRTYNLASGSEKQKERDERSYILGAWGKQKDLESNRSKPQYLRPNNSYSVLLAVFTNAQTKQEVTLAQVLWIDEKVCKLHLVATYPLSIDTNFRLQGPPKEWRKQLKAQSIEVFDEFSQYSRRFRQLLYIDSENALDLFNQIVSIKEIGGLNAFVRDHMLERTDAQKRIQQLQENFANLTRAHDAIQLAERQLEILEPLMQDARRYTEQQVRIDETSQSNTLLPIYIAQRKQSLLIQAREAAAQQVATLKTRRAELESALNDLNQQVISLNVAIQNDAVGQQIASLKQEIQTLQERQQERTRQATKYNRQVTLLNLAEYKDGDTFHANRRQAEEILHTAEQQLEALQQQRDAAMQKLVQLKNEQKQLTDELASLKLRSSQIPHEDILLRQRLISELQLAEEEIPFIGELLRVRTSEQRWEPAIERLLRNFGRRLLVDEHSYQRVSSYVDRTHLHGRLVYHHVYSNRTARYDDRLTQRSLYHKLEIKPGTPFTAWLSAEVIDNYNYLCCETLEDFQRVSHALTLNGQVKHGGARHEKDDSSALGDRRRYVLGWSNQEKRAALEKELAEITASLQQAEKPIAQIEQRRRTEQQRQDAARAVLEVDVFESIDWRSIARQQSEKQNRLHELEASSKSLETLRGQLAGAEKQVEIKQGERDTIVSAITTLEDDIRKYESQERACTRTLNETPIEQAKETIEHIEKDLKEILEREKLLTFALETIDDIRERLRQLYQNRTTALNTQLRQSAEKILSGMNALRLTNPILAQEMDASLEALGTYREFYEHIKHEDLPRHRRRFKELLNEKVITDIGSFQGALDLQEEEIKARIARLNKSLSTIGYTDVTYIQLNCERSYDTTVREFRTLLRACLPNVGQARTVETNEASFQRIHALLQRFDEDERWTKKVTDVRNWLDFSASELYQENGEQKNYYSDSSGKSGGQKAKLAYTILASAIAYRYNLDQEEGRERTFRFVAVDEAFNRSDERNARYAMDLFRQLDLQVLVVTPLDKIHVVENYISACHFTTNNEEENNSKVYNLTFAEYLKQKQSWQAGAKKP